MQATATKTSAKKATTNVTKNIVQLRNRFINLPSSKAENRQMAMSVASELMQFGYLPSNEAIDNIARASVEDITSFYNEVIPYLKEMTGSKRNHQAFWPGFPEQVMEKSEIELWFHQIVHYWSNGSYMPNDWTKDRPTAFEQPKYTKLAAGDERAFDAIFTDLVSVNQSLTPDDLEIIKWFVASGSSLVFPDSIPFKENLCTLAAMGLDVPVRTVTDVLRIAVGFSGGDISLPKVPQKLIKTNRWSSRLSENTARESFKFKKFTRGERKIILNLLEKTNCDATEAVLKDQRWVRLGEIVHPGEYKAKYPKAFKMFDLVRNNKVSSWYSKVNKGFKKSFEDGLIVLSERPGEFMRKLDWLVRNKNEANVQNALEVFERIASKVSNKVLYESFTHFEGRTVANNNRTIMVKGKRKRTKLPDLPALSPKLVASIQETITKALSSKFAVLPKLEKVYVDENLKNIPLPANMRTASSGLKPRIRGQRMPIGNQNAKVIRAFVHWFDEHGNQDIDLTVTLVGMGKREVIGWNGSHNSAYGTYSGDIRHRQGACAEYIDIKLDAALKGGFKYAILDARNYNGRPFDTVTDCASGYMERENAVANEKFVPSTIANCTKLTSESSTTLISVIDLETKEYIHLDIDQDGIPVASANFNEILESIKPYCEAPKFSVYDLVMMHINARGGELVEIDVKADTYFAFDTFSESYIETLKLMGI